MLATTLKRGALGFLLGMVYGILITIAVSFAQGGDIVLSETLLAATGSPAGALLAQILLSGLYGVVPMAGTVFYEFDSWSLLKQALVHYVSYTPIFIPIAVWAGWIRPSFVDIALVAGSFAVGHLIIWLIMYTRYRAEVKQLNELLEEAKGGN